jgi:hypothetical protein
MHRRLNGLEAARRLKVAGSRAKIVSLGTFSEMSSRNRPSLFPHLRYLCLLLLKNALGKCRLLT